MKYLFFGWVLFFCSAASGQASFRVTGRVTDPQDQPLSKATVRFLPEGARIGFTVTTDSVGVFELLVNAQKGTLIVTAASHRSYEVFLSFSDGAVHNLGSIALPHSDGSLSAVRVAAQRPPIRLESDRKIITVEGLISAKSASVLDLLEGVPGVTVNRSGNTIEVNGRTGLVLYVDGKPTYMSATELVQYLSGLNANSVRRIEVIDKPSARYEAEGNAGVINLVLQGTDRQRQGTLYVGGGWGKYPKGNAGVRFSTPLGKRFKVTGSYDVNRNKTFTDAYYTRIVRDVDIYQDYYLLGNDWAHSIRSGVEVAINSQSFFTLEGRSQISRNKALLKTSSFFRTLPATRHDSITYQTNKYPTTRDHHTINAGYTLKLDTAGGMLSLSGGWISFEGLQTDRIENRFVSGASGTALRDPFYLQGLTPIEIKTRAAQVDVEKKLNTVVRMEAGLRYSQTDIATNVQFASGREGDLKEDKRFSAMLGYRESIRAGYLNSIWEKKTGSIQGGVRIEHFKASGQSSKSLQPIHRDRVLLFPSLNIGWRVGEGRKLNVILNRRINRPSFQSLNPAINFVSYYSTYQGNPLLLPALSYNASVVYATRKSLQLQVGYTRSDDPIAYSFVQDDQSRVSEVSLFNFDKQDHLSFQASYPLSPLKGWRVTTSLNAFYNQFKQPGFVNSQWSLTGSVRNNFSLSRGWSADIGFHYRAPSVYGYLKEESWSNLTVGVQKEVRRFTFALTGRDVLRTMKFNNRVNFNNMDIGNFTRFETQVFSFAMSYRFLQGKGVNLQLKRSVQEEENRITG